MYSIKEIILIQMLCFFIAFNSSGAINYLKQHFEFLNGNFYETINELIRIFQFICENNPTLLHYYEYDDDDDDKEKNNTVEIVEEKKQIQIKYENKYLEKFKAFPNEFRFDETEFKQENEEYEKVQLEYEKKRLDTIELNQKRLFIINEIIEKGNIECKNDENSFLINDFGKNKIIEYYDMHEIYEDEPDDINFKELYLDLLNDKEVSLKNLEEVEKNVMTESDLRSKARDVIINKKLDKFIDNYVLEYTPLGNIFMRYNNDKKSFEYFSNNTIPYRYLEPVGRKYSMTYWCKPIFVDIEEELKKAEVVFDEEKKKKEEDEKRRQEEIKNNPKDVIARMKSYNKDTKSQTIMKQPMKNRSSNNVLPPQIKANLTNVNKNSEKQLLKEQANRYTWEGRLTNFSPLKKIDKKVLDKKLTMSYSEFKKMQQNKKYI